jgi:CheY-like chemotaxis protein
MQERLATVGQLAAGIAHDFNNIMAAILVYADLLTSDTSLPLASRERLHIIQQQVQRAASLIRQILDFSRRSVMEQSSLDLLPFIKELDKLLARVLPENIRLELEYQNENYLVNADPTRLQQAFMNLALNARDAMPQGGYLNFKLSRLQIKADQASPSSELPPGDWVHIVVADTGQGIPPETLPHIWEPFFTTKPVGQGTGLGLSQVYGIIKQHGGTIDVVSLVGEGTRFNIYLPALTVPGEEGMSSEAPARFDGTGKTVLVVEDDQVTRDAIQSLLKVYNFWVLTATNGSEAIRIYKQMGTIITMVVTDLVMPEMGGVALYHALQEQHPGVKVLFITGHPLEENSHALLEKGNVHWLQKPFSAKDFGVAMQALLAEELTNPQN